VLGLLWVVLGNIRTSCGFNDQNFCFLARFQYYVFNPYISRVFMWHIGKFHFLWDPLRDVWEFFHWGWLPLALFYVLIFIVTCIVCSFLSMNLENIGYDTHKNWQDHNIVKIINMFFSMKSKFFVVIQFIDMHGNENW